MLIMRKHRSDKWNRENWSCAKEPVRDSDKFSRPFALLMEKGIHSLKLHCQIRAGAGQCATSNATKWRTSMSGAQFRCLGFVPWQVLEAASLHQCWQPPLLKPASSTAKAFSRAVSSSGQPFLPDHICHSSSWGLQSPALQHVPHAIDIKDFSWPFAASRTLLAPLNLFTESNQQS